MFPNKVTQSKKFKTEIAPNNYLKTIYLSTKSVLFSRGLNSLTNTPNRDLIIRPICSLGFSFPEFQQNYKIRTWANFLKFYLRVFSYSFSQTSDSKSSKPNPTLRKYGPEGLYSSSNLATHLPDDIASVLSSTANHALAREKANCLALARNFSLPYLFYLTNYSVINQPKSVI